MVDSVYRTRSLGVATSGIPDQYADGKAAKLWELYIGDKNLRTERYKTFLLDSLRKYNCKTIMDVACGTGIDSVMLLENGFKVTSVDASDKMLKYALKQRWNRRKEKAFDDWVIEEANWLTLIDDLEEENINVGYDAVICLGNSFAHLPAFGSDQSDQRKALKNIADSVKPGGIFLVDHRNYDSIIDTGSTPARNIYYDSRHVKDIQTSVLYQNGKPSLVTLDYVMDIEPIVSNLKEGEDSERVIQSFLDHFRLSYYPHRLKDFTSLLKESFGDNCAHKVYGDFTEIKKGDNPAFYIHVVKKPL